MTTDLNDPTIIELAQLTAEVAGPVLVPGDEGYAEEIATWNQAVIHRPAVAVGATTAADVQAAVRFASAWNLPVAIVSTGHGAVHPADGAVLINLRRMNDIVVDAGARTATVGPGVEMQNLVDTAAREGLAPIAGSSPNIGVVGFTLGGGLSTVLGRTYGYAADHVQSAEIVTPDGELRHTDAQTSPDLFWAIRGGKGNFGVVVRMTVGLLPVTRLYGGGLFYPGEHAAEVLAAYRRLVADAPQELTASIAFLRLPPLPFVPEPLQGRFTVHVRIAYLGAADDGAKLVADLRGVAPILIDAVAEMPYTAIASIHADPVDPVPAYEISALLSGFPADAASALVAAAGPESDTSVLMVEIRQLGGALARQPETPSAVCHRDAAFQLFAGTVGAPGMVETFRPELDALVAALAPWATGGKQVNFLSVCDAAGEGAAIAYEKPVLDRLTQIKTAYDPRNLFRVGHTITPLP